MIKRLLSAALFATALLSVGGASAQSFSTAGFFAAAEGEREVANFNLGWRFHKGAAAGAETPDFDDSQWSAASLPHGLELLEENGSGGRNYQGEAWYRKRFDVEPSALGGRVYLYFEAVMGRSKVWINGHELTEHFGGYLPFAVDATEFLSGDGRANIVAVMADNSDDTSYPMGKVQSGADLSYLGGIYRDVYLISTPKVHISLTELSSRVAGGGIFVATTKAKDQSAEIVVRTELLNSGTQGERVVVKTILEDGDFNPIKSLEKELKLEKNSSKQLEQQLSVKGVRLWHPSDPYLHYIRTEVWIAGELSDCIRTRFGIRTIDMRGAEGLYVNGEPFEMKLIGSNRHQDYVYVGNALPNSGQWRDVKLLREGGCNIIRAAHYPLDPAYYDACDEFGMFTTSANPGWHFYNFKNPLFEQRLYEDTRNLVRKDRNRPSMLMWETAINETPSQPAEVMHNMHLAAHEEYPFQGLYTVTDIHEAQKAGMDIYYHGDDKNINSFTRECGDGGEVDNWYSHNAVTRVKMEWGERALIGQVEQLSYTLSGLQTTPKVRLGGALWAGIEHQRGYHPDPFWGGLLNLYRLPKYSYYLFQSQYSPDYKIKNQQVGPMIYIANELTQLSPRDVTIFSNCEQVRLSFNGEVIATLSPSAEGGYKNLPHAPFVFKDAFIFKDCKGLLGKGVAQLEMVAEGLIGGEVVITERKLYPLRSDAIHLELASEGLDLVADGSDFIPVRATIVDANGTKKVLASEYIHFEVEGEATIIGGQSNFANPMKSQYGTATILVRSSAVAGEIKVTARSQGLKSAELLFSSQPAEMAMNYDSDYLAASIIEQHDAVVVHESSKPLPTKGSSTAALEAKIKALELELVGRDQEIMELRSK